MNERLEQFLAAENISQAAFADRLNVARASISHILSGRNRPGYEFFASLIRNYPSLNIEWLISGKGKMYKDIQTPSVRQSLFPTEAPDITDVNSALADSGTGLPTVYTSDIPADSPAPAGKTEPQGHETDEKQSQVFANQRKAKRVIVFYDDGTFEELQK